MPSPRLSIRLPDDAMERLKTRSESLGMTPGEAAKSAVLVWADGSSEPNENSDFTGSVDSLPSALQLAYTGKVDISIAQNWLDCSGGSLERLEELSGLQLR